VKDLEGFEAECARAPSWASTARRSCTPRRSTSRTACGRRATDEVEHARKVIDAFAEAERDGRGVVTVDGRMVENLHRDNALRTLAVADAIAALS
jgi:citrate lyase subunit beta/citryl-CoA lyase